MEGEENNCVYSILLLYMILSKSLFCDNCAGLSLSRHGLHIIS